MASFTITPPVDCEAALTEPTAVARKTDRTVTTETVAGIEFTRVAGFIWRAQGWDLYEVEDSPAYWEACRSDDDESSPRHAARTRKRLIGILKRAGHLKKDAG
jgi:hypothetical protein